MYLGHTFLKRPKLLIRMLTSLKSQSQLDFDFKLKAVLLSICVDPCFSGNGAGKLMIQKLDNEFARNSVLNYYLTTDADDNDATNSFYKRNNFELLKCFYQGKRKMNLYIKEIL